MSNDNVDKTPCEVCGDMITTHKGGRASHMRKHNEVEQPAEAVVEKPVKADIKKVAETNSLKDEEKLILERALAAQENFRKAPDVFLSEDTTDENAALVQLYAPECLDKFNHVGKLQKKAERHAFFSSRANLAKRAAQGYVPVRGDDGQFVTNSGGDVLTACDRDLFESREKRAQNESRRIVRNVEKDLGKANLPGVEQGSNSDLRDVSLKVASEEIQL